VIRKLWPRLARAVEPLSRKTATYVEVGMGPFDR
jgi:hypothetical protein